MFSQFYHTFLFIRSHTEEVRKLKDSFNKEIEHQIEITKEKAEQSNQEIVEDLKYQLEEATNSKLHNVNNFCVFVFK